MARVFDGSADVFYKATTGLGNGFSAITVGGWVKRNGAQPDSGFGTMAGAVDTGASLHAWLIFIKDSGVRFRLYGGGSSPVWNISDDVTSGSWVHVCCSWTLSGSFTTKMYLNGVSKTPAESDVLAAVLNSSQPDTMLIGAANTTPSSFRFKGDLADVFVYNTQLSDANVLSLATGSRPGSVGSGLQGWWKLEESSASSDAIDEQAANNLTAVSSPATSSGPLTIPNFSLMQISG